MLLIGSHALILNGIDSGRQPKDIDIIGTYDELSMVTRKLQAEGRAVRSVPLSIDKTVLFIDDGRIIEWEIAWENSTGHELQGDWGHDGKLLYANMLGMKMPMADRNMLLSLKMSHRYLKNSPHFRKTRDDIMRLRAAGAVVHSLAWLKRREDATYTYKHPKLNVMKGDFFKGDGVEYVYDHDTIHLAMAHLPPVAQRIEFIEMFKMTRVPAYTLYMKDGAEVQTSKQKFFDAPEAVRLYGVLEEAQVLALERSQIPFRGKVDPRRSFDIALQKVCTSITSGWFREFAWENFDKVEAMYEPNYVDRFWKAVDDGIVRKIAETDR